MMELAAYFTKSERREIAFSGTYSKYSTSTSRWQTLLRDCLCESRPTKITEGDSLGVIFFARRAWHSKRDGSILSFKSKRLYIFCQSVNYLWFLVLKDFWKFIQTFRENCHFFSSKENLRVSFVSNQPQVIFLEVQWKKWLLVIAGRQAQVGSCE